MTLGNDVRVLSPPHRILPDLQKGTPLTEQCSLYTALQLSLKFPVNGLPTFPNKPLHRRLSQEISTTPFPQVPNK